MIEHLRSRFISFSELPSVRLSSQVREHSELSWVLGCVTPLGWLNRMTQFKQKAGSGRDAVDAAVHGLYAYPILQAADILLYRATEVSQLACSDWILLAWCLRSPFEPLTRLLHRAHSPHHAHALCRCRWGRTSTSTSSWPAASPPHSTTASAGGRRRPSQSHRQRWSSPAEEQRVIAQMEEGRLLHPQSRGRGSRRRAIPPPPSQPSRPPTLAARTAARLRARAPSAPRPSRQASLSLCPPPPAQALQLAS